MNRRLSFCLFVLGLGAWLESRAAAETFKLIDGGELTGEPIAFGRDGVAVKKPDGSFSAKVAWTNFTQEALKQLATLPRAKPFVDPLLEPYEPEPSRKVAPELKLKPVPRLDRPDPQAGLGALFSSSITVTMLLILYLANIYAGYEISIFRNQPAALVAGVAAVAPDVGPIVFLCMPQRIPKSADEEVRTPEHEAGVHDDQSAAFEMGTEDASTPSAPAPAGAAAKHPPPTVYKRGQTTFNRRFFETKLSGFLRIVPSEAEKDLILVIRSARGEHAGQRISRIMPNELCLLVQKGAASSEVIIPYAEIQEVQVRHKDA